MFHTIHYIYAVVVGQMQYRIEGWLEPSKETDTYGRDNFSIHGGWFSGSSGCIDLTSQIDNFVALFGFIGKDLIVNVQY